MAQPPHIIRIKRKRDEELPLDFIEFDPDGHKRARSSAHNVLYKRSVPLDPAAGSIQPASPPVPAPAPSCRPTIQTSAPGDEARVDSQFLPSHKATSLMTTTTTTAPAQRTFHISKADTERRLKAYSSTDVATGTKRPRDAIVFVEHDSKKMRAVTSGRVPVDPLSPTAKTHAPGDDPDVDIPVPATPSTQKRRTLAIPHSRLPSTQGMQRIEEPDMDKMAASMNQWALEVLDAEKSTTDDKKSLDKEQVRPKKPMTRFRPKAKLKPAPTLAEAPTLAPAAVLAPAPSLAPAADIARLAADSSDDDSDYIEEEYHIVDPRAVPSDVPRHMIGRLVVAQDEQEYFYEETNTMLPVYDSDESDENAENYYANDYPDQELESDDDEADNTWGPSFHAVRDMTYYATNEEFDAYNNDDDDDDAAAHDDDELVMSDYEGDGAGNVWAKGVRGVERSAAARERSGSSGSEQALGEYDARLLERIRRFNDAVNKHAGY